MSCVCVGANYQNTGAVYDAQPRPPTSDRDSPQSVLEGLRKGLDVAASDSEADFYLSPERLERYRNEKAALRAAEKLRSEGVAASATVTAQQQQAGGRDRAAKVASNQPFLCCTLQCLF